MKTIEINLEYLKYIHAILEGLSEYDAYKILDDLKEFTCTPERKSELKDIANKAETNDYNLKVYEHIGILISK